MIVYLLESSICAIVFIAFYYLALRNKSFHHWNRIYLLSSFLISLAIPLIYIPIQEIIYVQGPFGRTGASAPSLDDSIFSWQHFFMISYLIGFCVSLFLFLKELLQIRNIITQSFIKTFPNYTLVEVGQEFPLCSFFKYIIVDKNATLTAFELDHELSHIEQQHSYDKFFMEVMTIIFWFNPAVYLYRSSLHIVHEYLADNEVIKKHGQENYTNYLISVLTNRSKHLSAVNPFQSLIKNRLHMLYNKKESTKTIFLAMVPLILCLGFFISCEKVTKLEQADLSMQYPNLEFNDMGEVILRDTIIVFDEETYVEEMKIVTNTMSLEEYSQKQNSNDHNNRISHNTNEDSFPDVKLNDHGELEVILMDTILVFDEETQEEELKIVANTMSVEKYNQQQASKVSDWFNTPLEDNTVFVTVFDTIITFNDDTYEETMQIVKSTISLEEYEKRFRDE